MSIATGSLECESSDAQEGVSNMILLKQDNGTFILGASTADGGQIFSLKPGQIPVETYDIETTNPVEYTNLVLEESAIELIGQPSTEQNAIDIEDNERGERINNLIKDVKSKVTSGFNSINKRVRSLSKRCSNLDKIVDGIIKEVKNNGLTPRVVIPFGEKKSSSIVLGAHSSTSSALDDMDDEPRENSQTEIDKLSESQAYPNGSWLGDPKNGEKRIRCCVKEIDLKQLNATCTTPEKMALSLLDYLFDRETQAISNISGTSKHGKKQLDPVKIYGIRCHLEYIFQITNKDWHRIKQNIDSKCRTSFRRRVKGMPLKVKTTRQSSKSNEAGEALKFILAKPRRGEISLCEDESLNNEAKSVFAVKNINSEIVQYTTRNTVPIAIHTADGLTFSLPAETVEQNSQIIQVQNQGSYEIIHSIVGGGEFAQFQLENAQILEQFENQVDQEVIVGS